ncbi:MAG TPA: hypothetical protein VGL57_04345 [Solirubrobacteraceae bacterium]|jgi:hypothetical protein
MTKDPWTDPDPQPGDFDANVREMSPRDIQIVEAGSGAKVTILINVEGEDATRLQRIATERGQHVDEVISDLLRAVQPHAA